MPKRRKFIRRAAWVASALSLFVITLCASLVSLIVGDWFLIQTDNEPLAYGIGIFVFVGFLSSLGTAIGVWLWILSSPRLDSTNTALVDIPMTIETITGK